MSGILDPKTRVMDVVITDEGRRQMASGLMELAYVTFSDADVVYAKDLVSGTVDTTTYPHLEASTSQPHDLITYVTDDFGSLQPFKSLNSYTVRSGEILSGSDGVYSPVTSSAAFGAIVGDIVESSAEAFRKLQLLYTHDEFSSENDLNTSDQKMIFKINDGVKSKYDGMSIDDLPTLIEDKRFANLVNFSYLPPTYRDGDTKKSTGIIYKNVLMTDGSDIAVKKVYFSQDEKKRLLFQFFEVSGGKIKKLSAYRVAKSTYIVGKLYVNSSDVTCFCKLFSIKFELQ